MTLLGLPGGGFSLEFDRVEFEEVKAALKAMTRVTVRRHALYDEVQVGHGSVSLYHDWDEPCLLASDEAGVLVLRQVVAICS